MLRFLFFAVAIILFSKIEMVYATQPDLSFSQKHIYPVLKRGSDLHSGLTFLSGAMASVLARSSDDQIRDQWKDNQKMSKSDAHIGDLMGTGAATLLTAGAQYLFDQDESQYQSQLRGFVYGGLSIYILKTGFGRNRPGLSNSHQSFPSGHTAIVFMTATQLATTYGWPTGAVAFSLASFTAMSRLADDAHWFSDTVGGAFLGYFIGRATLYDSNDYLSDNNVSEKSAVTSIQIYPLFQSGAVGMTSLILF